jgi:hypothetical protein
LFTAASYPLLAKFHVPVTTSCPNSSLGRTAVAAQLVLKVPSATRRAVHRHNRQVAIARVSNVEEVGVCVTIWVDEEVAEAAIIWTCSADFIVQIRCQGDASATGSSDMHAVAAEITVVTKVDRRVGALLDVRDGDTLFNVGRHGDGGGGSESDGEDGSELHIDDR